MVYCSEIQTYAIKINKLQSNLGHQLPLEVEEVQR